MIITGILLLLAGAFMFTQSQQSATALPCSVMTIGAALLLVGIFL
jgi:uncharacterized membrane protein HdeD (DUF308 family)